MTQKFDIGVGGHTHRGTLCVPFIPTEDYNDKAWAVLTGTYKLEDKYARSLGFRKCAGSGVGCHIFFPDGRLMWIEDLQTAAQFLTYLRREQ